LGFRFARLFGDRPGFGTEPQVQAFIASFVQVCSIAPACSYGVDLEKSPGTDLDLTLPHLLSAIPVKALDARPLAVQDGGGLCSQPDWSHVSSGQDCPIFADAEISDLRGIVEA
ncbi:unnamed protein product, partial [Effrenium voratum]